MNGTRLLKNMPDIGTAKKEREMNKIIAEHWRERKLPNFDCVVYPDGTVTVLDCYSLQNSQTKKRELFCRPLCDTTIESVNGYNPEAWTCVDEWTRIACDGGSLIGGDGAMGNMGFIARVDVRDALLWAIFFYNSNPIRELSVDGSKLTAINEHSNVRIDINLECLTDITKTILREY
jgi:hypothetical protein